MSANGISVANAPISYGAFELTVGIDPSVPDAEELLDRVAEAGYAGIDLGPVGYLGSGHVLRERLESRGLGLTGGYLELPFSDHEALERSMPELEALLLELDMAPASAPPPRPTLADAGSPARRAAPGRAAHDRSVGLQGDAWERFAEELQKVVDHCRAWGHEPTLHCETGTYVEAEWELDTALELTDIGLCLETGDQLVGGRGHRGRDLETSGVLRPRGRRPSRGRHPRGADRHGVRGLAGGGAGSDARSDGCPGSDRARPGREPRVSARQASMTPAGAFDVVTMGRIGVDIYPLQTGVSLREVETFGKYLGGSPTNVAVAAARLGRRCAVVTRTGSDPFGAFIHDALREYRVDDRWVSAVAGLPTPITFCEVLSSDDFPLYFYRYPKAPDLEISADELDLSALRAAGILWVTTTGLCAEPSREATLVALRARDPDALTILDLDYREVFWDSREEARRWVQEALQHATVVVGNRDECAMAVGELSPPAAADALRERGVRTAIVKRGPAGVYAVDDDGPVDVPAVAVEVVNGLGAGDAFGGALCHSLLSGWSLERSMRFCNAAGALVAARLACSEAMPTADEINALLNRGQDGG